MQNGTRPEGSADAQADGQLRQPASFADRSLYLSCAACGSLVYRRDERVHRAHHEALAVLTARVLGTSS